ncbi:MAG: hypothetical protein JO311_00515 [Candidatus Eremiobacteraeota bacterium]|nr:hypothetical protein [Candidatus Eremiobacteraeota bacterium]
MISIVLSALLAAPTMAPSAIAPSPLPSSPAALYSRRALRRAKLIIQMEMLQLRNERLDCIRAVLLRRLPEALRPQQPATSLTPSKMLAPSPRCSELLNY